MERLLVDAFCSIIFGFCGSRKDETIVGLVEICFYVYGCMICFVVLADRSEGWYTGFDCLASNVDAKGCFIGRALSVPLSLPENGVLPSFMFSMLP